ncbi:MAG: polyamine ABC transporter ATP-binding protein [Deltaproteobacteria bacterium CG03_land_8_20_14_0_80_45_14]|nr:MAG: polyamine ABC transporter ATP-binding protein [Deltaproteobacteria bacterium CG03_land_8_20_14_0_80_45_14]
MAFIKIENLFKKFGNVAAVNHVWLEVKQGEILTLLGPSGCGKTTTLRCIAGLEKPDEGDVIIDGKSMFSQGFVPPSKREIGMVFQNYAVWPHMRVFDNVAYGLKIQKLPKKVIKKKVAETLESLGLTGLEGRFPGQLSGGQQQRVALARALVGNPKVLLLDEPLSNLDAKLREKMRFEIKSLVRRMGITSVYVTHDQAEAMVISDRVSVMNTGNIVQVGTPEEIYKKPATRFVADFIGTTNFITGEILEVLKERGLLYVHTEFGQKMLCKIPDPAMASTNNKVNISIRPEDIEIFTEPREGRDNLFKATIMHRAYLGNFLYLFVNIDSTMIRVQAPYDLMQKEGEELFLFLNPEKCVLLP